MSLVAALLFAHYRWPGFCSKDTGRYLELNENLRKKEKKRKECGSIRKKTQKRLSAENSKLKTLENKSSCCQGVFHKVTHVRRFFVFALTTKLCPPPLPSGHKTTQPPRALWATLTVGPVACVCLCGLCVCVWERVRVWVFVRRRGTFSLWNVMCQR